MKKLMFVLTVFLLLAGPCLAYTVTGHVYNKGTGLAVPYANVSLSCPGTPATTTADQNGSFLLTCSGDMSGQTLYLSASSGYMHGQTPLSIIQNYETGKNVYIGLTIQPIPSLNISPLPAHWPGAGPATVTSNVQIQSPNGPVQVQNVQVNMVFNPEIVVNDVVPTSAVPTSSFSFDKSVPGELKVNVEFDPPKHIDFPAESFFDVFYQIDIPETDATVIPISLDAEGIIIIDGIHEDGSAIPTLTEYLAGEAELCKPYFLIDNEAEWLQTLEFEWPQPNISPMTPAEWNDPDWGYMKQWSDWLEEGDPYPPNEFLPSELHVYEGGGSGGTDPEDAGLVMKWGDENTPTGDYASAWKYDYGLDPDLSNSIITITVTAPQFGAAGQINAVSFGIQDVNGNIRSWWWSCGPAPAPIPWNVPTTVTIDASQTGLAAATPVATGFVNNPAFNSKTSQFFIVDENFQWVFGQVPVPPPGQPQFVGMWNYWHNLTVTPKSPSGGANSKWYLKWSQPPVVLNEPNDPALIHGWDEVSMTQRLPNDPNTPIMADDWQCDTDRPVTDIHWWGSFKGWTQPALPKILPSAFHIGIWTDQPDPNPTPGIHNDEDWSHPLTLVWENTCTTAVWNFAGYDVDPRIGDPDQQENEACFQWAQFLSQDEWFLQEEGTNVYWVSIAAIYPANTDFTSPDFYPWGWKTRPHKFNDDAVRIIKTSDGTWPPVLGTTLGMNDCVPIHIGDVSWDLAFELTTNEPGYEDDPIPGDITGPGGTMVPDGTVDLNDLAVVAQNWLTVVAIP